MPVFYFDVTDGGGLDPDEIGTNSADRGDARAECLTPLPSMVRHERRHRDPFVITCDVRDESGSVVYRGRLMFEEMPVPAVDARALP